jgi:hypothetical protein
MALGGGQPGRSSTTGEAPWRFSVAVPILRRQSGGKARAEVGPIWAEGAWDGRSTARWRAPTAVGSPARLPGAIGEWNGCVVFMRERWSSRATLIGLEFNRERRAGLTGAEEGHGGAKLDSTQGRGEGVADAGVRKDGARAILL